MYRRPTRVACSASHVVEPVACRAAPRRDTISPAWSAPSSARASAGRREARSPPHGSPPSAISGGARPIHARLPTARAMSLTKASYVHREGPAASSATSAVRQPGLDAERGRVPNRHELDLVAPVARDEEHRHVPQPPGDVVDEDVLRTEDERRAARWRDGRPDSRTTFLGLAPCRGRAGRGNDVSRDWRR